MIGMLKDYMEGGNVNRGKVKIQEDTSIIYMGNLEVKEGRPKFNDFLRDMPHAFKDTAFIDRIHGIIPGWAVPKITETKKHFAKDYGLTGNYLSEALHKLRAFRHPDLRWDEYEKNLVYIRNEKSIRCDSSIGPVFRVPTGEGIAWTYRECDDSTVFDRAG